MSARSGNPTVEELAKRSAVAGSLADLGALDLMQAIHDSKRSAALSIRSAEQLATLFFRDGDIIDARLGTLHGEHAIYHAVTWTRGSFEVEFRESSREDSMRTSTRRVLWEGRRRLEERQRRIAQLPDLGGIFDVDCPRLLKKLAELPDEMNLVLKHFDGELPLQEILARSELDELTTLAAFARLLADRLIYNTSMPVPSVAPASRRPGEGHRGPASITTLPPPRFGTRNTLDYELNNRDRSAPSSQALHSPLPDRLPGERTLRGMQAPRPLELSGASSLVPPSPPSGRPTVRAAPANEARGSAVGRSDRHARRGRRRKRVPEGLSTRRVRTLGTSSGLRSGSPASSPSARVAAKAANQVETANAPLRLHAHAVEPQTNQAKAESSRALRTTLALALVLLFVTALVMIARQFGAR